MGARGPVPKRSSERRRQNKDSKPTKAKAKAPAKRPKAAEVVTHPISGVAIPPAKSTWNPIAKEWYLSLAESGQSQFYEPSDWQAAVFVADVMTRNLRATKFSAHLFASVWAAMGELLTTEGARRRVRLEIEREPPGDQPSAGVTALSDYRKRLTG